jgi:hypothetical protein
MHRSHRGWRALVAGIAACMLLLTAGIGPAAAAAPPVQITATIGEACVSATKPSGDLVKLTLRTGSGHYLGTEEDATSSTSFLACFTHRVRIGYRITIVDGDDSRTVGVPDLTIAGDRITNVVSGHGPASKHITVKYGDCNLSGCAGYTELDRTVDSHGRWHRDLTTSIDLQGADRIAAQYTNSRGDQFYTQEEHLPYLQLSRPNKVHIECQPDRAVNVTLRTAGGTLRASRSLPKAGGCATPDAAFRRNGAAVNIAMGNIIRSDLASDVRLVGRHGRRSAMPVGFAIRCRSLSWGVAGVRAVRHHPIERALRRQCDRLHGPVGRRAPPDLRDSQG